MGLGVDAETVEEAAVDRLVKAAAEGGKSLRKFHGWLLFRLLVLELTNPPLMLAGFTSGRIVFAWGTFLSGTKAEVE